MGRNDATSRGRLTEGDGDLAEPAAEAAASTGVAGQIRDESQLVDAGAAGDLLGDATVETATKRDGRYVIYYVWPDDV